jgi:hypothetical protein
LVKHVMLKLKLFMILLKLVKLLLPNLTVMQREEVLSQLLPPQKVQSSILEPESILKILRNSMLQASLSVFSVLEIFKAS